MTIKFLGHATFLITSEGGLRIMTDPYDPDWYGAQFRYRPITDAAAIVTISHDHADHNYPQGIPGSPVVLTSSGEVRGISFEVTASFHDAAEGAERGRNRIFCFEVDGIRLCHLGDLGHPLTAEQAAAIGEVDVLLIPVSGTATIDASQATEMVAQLGPAVVIPMHFKTPQIDFPFAPVDDFVAGKDNVEKVGRSEVSICREDLGTEPRIIVLEPAN